MVFIDLGFLLSVIILDIVKCLGVILVSCFNVYLLDYELYIMIVLLIYVENSMNFLIVVWYFFFLLVYFIWQVSDFILKVFDLCL